MTSREGEEFEATHQLPVELQDGLVSTPQLLPELLHLLQESLHLHAHVPGAGWNVRNVRNVAQKAGFGSGQVEPGGVAALTCVLQLLDEWLASGLSVSVVRVSSSTSSS